MLAFSYAPHPKTLSFLWRTYWQLTRATFIEFTYRVEILSLLFPILSQSRGEPPIFSCTFLDDLKVAALFTASTTMYCIASWKYKSVAQLYHVLLFWKSMLKEKLLLQWLTCSSNDDLKTPLSCWQGVLKRDNSNKIQRARMNHRHRHGQHSVVLTSTKTRQLITISPSATVEHSIRDSLDANVLL